MPRVSQLIKPGLAPRAIPQTYRAAHRGRWAVVPGPLAVGRWPGARHPSRWKLAPGRGPLAGGS